MFIVDRSSNVHPEREGTNEKSVTRAGDDVWRSVAVASMFPRAEPLLPSPSCEQIDTRPMKWRPRAETLRFLRRRRRRRRTAASSISSRLCDSYARD